MYWYSATYTSKCLKPYHRARLIHYFKSFTIRIPVYTVVYSSIGACFFFNTITFTHFFSWKTNCQVTRIDLSPGTGIFLRMMSTTSPCAAASLMALITLWWGASITEVSLMWVISSPTCRRPSTSAAPPDTIAPTDAYMMARVVSKITTITLRLGEANQTWESLGNIVFTYSNTNFWHTMLYLDGSTALNKNGS